MIISLKNPSALSMYQLAQFISTVQVAVMKVLVSQNNRISKVKSFNSSDENVCLSKVIRYFNIFYCNTPSLKNSSISVSKAPLYWILKLYIAPIVPSVIMN